LLFLICYYSFYTCYFIYKKLSFTCFYLEKKDYWGFLFLLLLLPCCDHICHLFCLDPAIRRCEHDCWEALYTLPHSVIFLVLHARKAFSLLPLWAKFESGYLQDINLSFEVLFLFFPVGSSNYPCSILSTYKNHF